MQLLNKIVLLLFFFVGLGLGLAAQTTDSTAVLHKTPATKDSIPKQKTRVKLKKDTYVDTVSVKDPRYRNPAKASFRSAVLPGWGQVYNRRIWKVPIVYAGLGITAGFFADNLVWYKRFRKGVDVGYNIIQNKDSTGYGSLNSQIRKVFFEGTDVNSSINVMRNNRDQYRRNVDYSAVFFVIAWALNVVDATVDAHLSTFDISPKLALKLSPPTPDINTRMGFAVALQFK
ncbi:MAG: hypothetical protein J7539_09745 [Niabella sp.]|nr:hypothetical protein [Niabella sp.]